MSNFIEGTFHRSVYPGRRLAVVHRDLDGVMAGLRRRLAHSLRRLKLNLVVLGLGGAFRKE